MSKTPATAAVVATTTEQSFIVRIGRTDILTGSLRNGQASPHRRLSSWDVLKDTYSQSMCRQERDGRQRLELLTTSGASQQSKNPAISDGAMKKYDYLDTQISIKDLYLLAHKRLDRVVISCIIEVLGTTISHIREYKLLLRSTSSRTKMY